MVPPTIFPGPPGKARPRVEMRNSTEDHALRGGGGTSGLRVSNPSVWHTGGLREGRTGYSWEY